MGGGGGGGKFSTSNNHASVKPHWLWHCHYIVHQKTFRNFSGIFVIHDVNMGRREEYLPLAVFSKMGNIFIERGWSLINFPLTILFHFLLYKEPLKKKKSPTMIY